MGKRKVRQRGSRAATRPAPAPAAPGGWSDPAWVLLAAIPAAVPLAHDPFALQLKRVLALLLITAGLAVLLARDWRAPHRRPVPTVLALPALAVLAAAALSLGAALNRYEGVLALYVSTLLSLGLLTWMASTIRSREQVLWLLAALCAAATLAAGVGIIQFTLPDSFAGWGARGAAIGTTGNTNYLGAFLAMAGPIALGLALGAPGAGHRALGLGGFGVITLGLIATRTRAAWLGYLAGLGVTAALAAASRMRQRAREPQPIRHSWWGPAAAGTVLAAFLVGMAVNASRGESLVGRFVSIADRRDSSIAARLQWWVDAARMIRDHPFVGVGIGNSPLVFLRYNRAPESAPKTVLYLEHLHNEPLAMAAETGVVGVAASGLFLVALARLARRAVRGANGAGDPLGMAAVGALVAAGVDSLFFFNLHEMTSGASIWLVVGLVEALARLDGREQVAQSGGAAAAAWWKGVNSPVGRWGRIGVAGALVAAFWFGAMRPGMADYDARRGMVELDAGRASRAVSLLEAARAWDPRSNPAQYLLGQARQEEGRNDEAIQAFQAALRLNPMDVAALNSIGFLYRMAGRTAEARQMYERALAINPSVATTHKNLGDLLLFERKPAESLAHFHRALELVPRYAPAANAIGLAHIQLNQSEEAGKAFGRAVELDPGFAEAWLNLFTWRGSRGDWPGAARALVEVIRLRPSLEAEARNTRFFPQVWAAGISLNILPARAR